LEKKSQLLPVIRAGLAQPEPSFAAVERLAS
jgi:hypothetical protein